MADDVEVKVETSTVSIDNLLDSVKKLDNSVVTAAKDVVSSVSPRLADTLVSVDKIFKNFYGGVFRGALNFVKGVAGPVKE